MKAFKAIIALTFRNAVRSHIFQLLLILLLICVTVIPMSISVGKIDDLIRVSLLYSLWAVSIILTLSSLWLGCYIMSRDIDSYQIHMLVSKPVHRVVIWLGKWVGINLINFVLLLLAGLVIYGIVMTRYYAAGRESMLADREVARKNAEAEKERIRSQILVGRREYLPKSADPEFEANMRVRRYLESEARKQPDLKITAAEITKMRDEIKMQLDKLPVEVGPGEIRYWEFENIPEELNDSQLILRYRPYLKKVSSEDQRDSRIQVRVRDTHVGQDGQSIPVDLLLTRDDPSGFETHFTGMFHEKFLPAGVISEDGKVIIGLVNGDLMMENHYYQTADGPKLLIPVCSFEANYLRAILVMMIQLMLLSGLACAFGGFMTMPTAIFMVVSYLLFGALSMVLTDSEFFVSGVFDRFGQILANGLLTVIIPLQKFDVTDMLSNGVLIEFKFIGKLFFEYFVLRGMPLFLLGIWQYSRREVGAEVRKYE